MKVLVTGSEGFIGQYLVGELLEKGHTVIGLDNLSRYGEKKSYSKKSKYKFVLGDAKNSRLLKHLLKDCDQLIALAASVGGIDFFHQKPYDLLAENERIAAATFDAAIYAHQKYKLKKITVFSSSMVFESTKVFPTPETEIYQSAPPKTSYGFQKLSVEYFCRAAWDQYRLPYTIIRPCNVIGIGEKSHVIFDLARKILRGQNPLHILGNGKQIRHFIYVKDLVRGIVLSLSSIKSKNQDFNFSTNKPITVLQLAKLLWKKINSQKPFQYVSDPFFQKDVQKNSPDITKVKKILKFQARTSLEDVLDEIIPWIKKYE